MVDKAGQKGTGRWTVQTALDLAAPVTAIAQATFSRAASGRQSLREAYRGLPGGIRVPLSRTEATQFARNVESALYASKVIVYDQGWTMIQSAAAEYGWDIDLSIVAQIWRDGCIIRAAFLDRVRSAYVADPGMSSLLVQKDFAEEITQTQVPWRETIVAATRRGIPPRPSRRRWPRTTRCVPSVCPPPSSRASGTSSARMPMSAPTAPAPSTPTGERMAVRKPGPGDHYRRQPGVTDRYRRSTGRAPAVPIGDSSEGTESHAV